MLSRTALSRAVADVPTASACSAALCLPAISLRRSFYHIAFRHNGFESRVLCKSSIGSPARTYATEAVKTPARKAGGSTTRKRAASKPTTAKTNAPGTSDPATSASKPARKGKKPGPKKSSTTKAKSTSRPSAKKSTTAEAKSTSQSKTTRATKPKSKSPRAKRAANTKKAGRAKKTLTAEQKERAIVRKLRAEALQQPHLLPDTAWMVLHAEMAKANSGGDVRQTMKSASERYKSLTPAELEHYNHIANGNKAKNEATLKEWVESHTPEQIRLANNARRNLRRRMKKSGSPGHGLNIIHDERLAKQPASQYVFFHKERYNSGDFKHMKLSEAAKLIGQEWRALSASEKQKYVDLEKAARARYDKEYADVYGHPVPRTEAKAAK